MQKISANRRNARLSTGPKTKLGKAQSALNTVKHGIFTKEYLKNVSAEALQDYEALRWNIFESLKPQNELQAVVCDKIAIDVWRLRKVLAYEQGTTQLKGLKLDYDSPVELSKREAMVRNLEDYKSERENLNQLKKWLTSSKIGGLSALSSELYELLFEIIQQLK